MSDTPRTDAEVNQLGKSGVDWHASGRLMADFARQLERELNAMQADDQNWKAKAAELDHKLAELVALQSPPAEKVCVWRPIPGEAVVWVPKMQTDCGHALYPEFDHLSGGPPCPHCGGRIKVEDSCPA